MNRSQKPMTGKPRSPELAPDVRISRVVIYLALFIFAVVTALDLSRAVIFFPLAVTCIFLSSRIRSRYFCAADMALICYFIYFAISPIQRIDEAGISGPTLRAATISSTAIVKAAVLSTVMLWIFCLVGFLFPLLRRPKERIEISFQAIRFSGWSTIVIAVCLVAYVLHVLTSGGLGNVLVSRSQKSADVSGSIFPALTLGIYLIGTFFFLLQWKSIYAKTGRLSLDFWWWLVSMLLLAIVVNPFNVPRFVNLAVWLPVMLIFLGRWRTPQLAYGILLGGLMVAMPIMSLTTRKGVEGAMAFDKSTFLTDIFVIKDVDVFDTLVYSIDYPKDHGYSRGRSVMAIALFFVPRAVWPSKPIVGGLEVGAELENVYKVGTSNLSFFLGGDFYLDFGWFGVIAGSVAFSLLLFLVPRFDVRYGSTSMFDALLCGSIPILLRGPVGAVCGYFVAFAIVLIGSVIFFRSVRDS